MQSAVLMRWQHLVILARVVLAASFIGGRDRHRRRQDVRPAAGVDGERRQRPDLARGSQASIPDDRHDALWGDGNGLDLERTLDRTREPKTVARGSQE